MNRIPLGGMAVAMLIIGSQDLAHGSLIFGGLSLLIAGALLGAFVIKASE